MDDEGLADARAANLACAVCWLPFHSGSRTAASDLTPPDRPVILPAEGSVCRSDSFPKGARHGERPLHERAHNRRHRRATLPGGAARTGQPDRPRRAGHAQPPHRRGDGDRRGWRDPDARHVRGAHALRLDQLQDAGRHPEDAARGAHPVGGAGGQALPGPRLDVLRGRGDSQAAARLRDSRRYQRGADPRPALPAASQEITVTGSLGDDMLPHLPFPEMSFGCVVDGADGMRKAVRMFLKYGVDQVKLNLSGDNLVPGADARTSWMSDEEVAVAAHEVKVRGKRLASHARSSESVKQSMRHGVEVIYHASFADEEALDMMEEHKDRIFVAPGLSVIIRLLHEGEVVGVTNAIAKDMGYELELEAAVKSMKAMLRRGIRDLPGGDYGFAWAPHGENAKDLEYFVKYLGMTPMETLIAATRWGGQIMMKKDLGELREGWLADLLLVDGDPLANISILQDRSKLLAIVKDGEFAKAPEIRSTRSRFVA